MCRLLICVNPDSLKLGENWKVFCSSQQEEKRGNCFANAGGVLVHVQGAKKGINRDKPDIEVYKVSVLKKE